MKSIPSKKNRKMLMNNDYFVYVKCEILIYQGTNIHLSKICETTELFH